MTNSEIDSLLKQGISAARVGETEQARSLLLQVVELDEANVSAWLWLSGVIDDHANKITCLQNVLELDPQNRPAQAGLERLGQQSSTSPSPVGEVSSEPAKPARTERTGSGRYKRLAPPSADDQEVAPVRYNDHLTEQASVAGTLLGSSYAAQDAYTGVATDADLSKASSRNQQHISAAGIILKDNFAAYIDEDDEDKRVKAKAPKDPLANQYLCPRCIAPTQPDDKKCKKCDYKLWMRVLRHQKPSLTYKSIRTFYLLYVPYLAFLTFLVTFWPGFIAKMPPNAARMILMIFWLGLIVTSILLIGILKRWQLMYYFLLVNSVAIMAQLLAGIYFFYAVSGLNLGFSQASILAYMITGFLAFVGIGQFFLTLSLGRDFTYNKYRILLRTDPSVKTVHDFLERGRYYADKGVWGKAAVHFRFAAYQMAASVEPQLALAVVYINLKMYDQAEEPLTRARALDPLNPKLKELTALLETKRAER